MTTHLANVLGTPELPTSVGKDDLRNKEFEMILFQAERPIADGELNQLQLSENILRRKLLRSILPDVGIMGAFTPAPTGVPNELRLNPEGVSTAVVVDGIIKTLYAYDDPVDAATKGRAKNRIKLPNFTAEGQGDIVYLEVWFEEIQAPKSAGLASTTVYDTGMVGNFTLTNTLLPSEIPLTETTRRVQLRGKLTAANRDKDLSGVQAKGTSQSYQKVGGFFRAGNGDAASGAALGTVDGYAYALPLIKTTRSDPSTFTNIEIIPVQTGKVGELVERSIRIEHFSTELKERIERIEQRDEELRQFIISCYASLQTQVQGIADVLQLDLDECSGSDTPAAVM